MDPFIEPDTWILFKRAYISFFIIQSYLWIINHILTKHHWVGALYSCLAHSLLHPHSILFILMTVKILSYSWCDFIMWIISFKNIRCLSQTSSTSRSINIRVYYTLFFWYFNWLLCSFIVPTCSDDLSVLFLIMFITRIY